jgi:hypothetical protein
MYDRRFNAQAKSVLVPVSSSTGLAASQISTGGNIGGALLSNGSSLPVYVQIGSSSVAAAAPTTTTPAFGMMLLPGRDYLVDVPFSTSKNWISAVTSGGTATPLVVTPGDNSGN